MNANFDQHVHYHHTVIPTELEGSAVALRVCSLGATDSFSVSYKRNEPVIPSAVEESAVALQTTPETAHEFAPRI